MTDYLWYFFLVSISFDNYRKIHPGILEEYDETSSEEELDYEDNTKPTTKGTVQLQITSVT